MNRQMELQCPRLDDISALIDDVITGPARKEIAAHTASCPVCSATARELTAMRARLQTLRDVRCDVDIAALIEDRLQPRAPPRPRERRRKWDFAWQWAPRGLAATGVLAAGVYLGLLLAGGATAMRPTPLAVFDPVPPGALCVGQPWCGPGGR